MPWILFVLAVGALYQGRVSARTRHASAYHYGPLNPHCEHVLFTRPWELFPKADR